MKFLKLFAILILLTLGTGALLVLTKDVILRSVFESAVRALTGFDASVESVGLDLGRGALQIKGLTILNPYDYKERIFADIPEIAVRLDLGELLQKKGTHIHELILNIRELNIEKNAAGISNVSLLASDGKPKRAKISVPTPQAPEKKTSFYLDRLEVTLRRVRYYDRSGIVPKKLSMDMKMDKVVFQGIQDPKTIINVILMKVITTGSLGNLGLNPAEIQDRIQSSAKMASEFGEKVFVETGGQLYGRSEDMGKKVVGDLDSAKAELGGLFSKLKSKLTENQPEGQTEPSQSSR